MKLDDPNWRRAMVGGVRYVACNTAGPDRMSIERMKWLIGTPAYNLARWADDGGGSMKRALCPFCELPRAMVSTVRCGSHDIPLVSCACVPRDRFWSLDLAIRAVPMTENHDPGDEERA